jgi:streptomycin 6-kinase
VELPSIIAAATERWSLRIARIFEAPQMIGFVAAVDRDDGSTAVLKVNAPDRESEREADALGLWDGRGAARLLASEPAERTLLLERCFPGTPLWDLGDDDEATRIAASMLRRIWRPPPPEHPFASVVDVARRWAEELPATFERLGRPFAQRLLDVAVGACRELIAEPVELVVVHQDLHGGNILRAEREPWLVIDPKPLVGERAFDVVSLVRDRRDLLLGPDGLPIVRRRLDILAAELALDRERMRLWSLIHALAWGVEDGGGGYDPAHVHVARLLADA